ncbi:hypothetical protein H8356DRAFT_1332640 [Neocallimastix lanati (nom. inval.)]|nr:hypothetical protein H8356DRAFT_1332640 [Neocallimastix sp. JGI-2020a]
MVKVAKLKKCATSNVLFVYVEESTIIGYFNVYLCMSNPYIYINNNNGRDYIMIIPCMKWVHFNNNVIIKPSMKWIIPMQTFMKKIINAINFNTSKIYQECKTQYIRDGIISPFTIQGFHHINDVLETSNIHGNNYV